MKKVLTALLAVLLICLAVAALSENGEAADSWTGLSKKSEYGYAQLASRPNGKAMQAFYRKLQKKVAAYGQTDQDAPESLILATYRQKNTSLNSEEMNTCYSSLMYDHPEYFWVSEEAATQYNANTLEIRILPECRLAAERKKIGDAVFAQAEKLLTEIKKNLPKKADVVKRAEATYDALIKSMEYNLEAKLAHTIAGAFWGREGVCTAYAKAYKYLLERQGIRAVVAAGIAGGEAHAWDLVQTEDGSYFPADPTWDDGHFDEANRLYFNIPLRIFNMFHEPWAEGNPDFVYPLPAEKQPMPVFTQAKGTYVNKKVTIKKDMTLQKIFSLLSPVCRKAVLGGKGSFGIRVGEEEKELVLAALLQGVKNAEGVDDYFFDLYMRDAAVDLSGIYAGLTGEFTYKNGILTIPFRLYKDGTQPERVYAYADDEYLGAFVSLAAAYDAMKDRTADKLTLYITMAENYYLPEKTPTPAVKQISISGQYGKAHVFTLRGAALDVDLDLCSVHLLQYGPMKLDLTGHTLSMRESVAIGQFNISTDGQDTGMAKQASLVADRIVVDGPYIMEFFCSVKARELLLQNMYSLSIRGKGVTARFDRVEVAGGSEEYIFSFLNAGENDTVDAVKLYIGDLSLGKNHLLTLSTISGPQVISVGNIDNQSGFSLPFHMNYQAFLFPKEKTFVLPRFEITGQCNSSIQLELQSHTTKTLKKAQRMVEEGDAVLYAPNITPGVNDYVAVSIYYSFDPNQSADSFSTRGFRMEKDADGYWRLVTITP